MTIITNSKCICDKCKNECRHGYTSPTNNKSMLILKVNKIAGRKHGPKLIKYGKKHYCNECLDEIMEVIGLE